jgi:hypothetical protein
MRFVLVRLSDRKSLPVPQARRIGQTMFGDPVYGVEVTTLEEAMQLAVRSPASAPGDIAVTLWRKAPPGLSLPPELEDLPLIEIYDDLRDSY